jgi:hypothetical protein
MIGQYLSNTNENATVSIFVKKIELNKAFRNLANGGCTYMQKSTRIGIGVFARQRDSSRARILFPRTIFYFLEKNYGERLVMDFFLALSYSFMS